MAPGRPLLRAPSITGARRLYFLRPNNADYIRDWTALVAEEGVVIFENDVSELSGRVDAVTDDGSVLWFQLEAGAGRRLFAREDGALVWRVRGQK